MLVIGLMSGTSCDGIDAAYLETDGEEVVKVLAEYSISYNEDFQKQLINLMRTKDKSWLEIEQQLTYHHAEVVRKIRQISGIDKQPDAIGFHGQTIYHNPESGITWQIGNPHLLAKLTGIGVVSDFRRRDIAHGGQGAPLVPIFHKVITKGCDLPVAIINIGGCANVTYIGTEGELIGYDIGPGNALINDAMVLLYNKSYDQDGQVAAAGKVDQRVLDQILSDHFFAKTPPKSLDRNHFSYLANLLKDHSPEDMVATLTMLSAEAMARGLRRDIIGAKSAEPRTIYLCGGGSKNKTMTNWLQSKVSGRVAGVEELGFKPEYIEAQAFAYLAARTLKNLPSSFPSTTGVSEEKVAGVFFGK